MRFHVNLPVADVERSVAFYRELFRSEPVKQRDDYAKFLPPDVALNISFRRDPEGVAALETPHLGFEVLSREALERAHRRLAAAGLAETRETSVCCYALQDKFWVTDPDGYRWELYYLVEDTAEKMSPSTGCCASDAACGGPAARGESAGASEPSEARPACC